MLPGTPRYQIFSFTVQDIKARCTARVLHGFINIKSKGIALTKLQYEMLLGTTLHTKTCLAVARILLLPTLRSSTLGDCLTNNT